MIFNIQKFLDGGYGLDSSHEVATFIKFDNEAQMNRFAAQLLAEHPDINITAFCDVKYVYTYNWDIKSVMYSTSMYIDGAIPASSLIMHPVNTDAILNVLGI